MANVDRPDGLKFVRMRTGGDPVIERLYISSASTNIFRGDPIVYDSSGNAAGTAADAEIADVNSPFVSHVVVDIDAVANTTAPTVPTVDYLASGASGYVFAIPVRNAVFEIQEDSVGGNMAVTAISEFCDLTFGAGSTTTGLSGCELDSSDAGTGDNVRILRLVNRPDNALGTNARWEVEFNEQAEAAVGTPV